MATTFKKPDLSPLINSGFTPDQAEAIADFLDRMLGEHLATKADLDLGLARLKTELVMWMAGINLAVIAVTVGLRSLIMK